MNIILFIVFCVIEISFCIIAIAGHYNKGKYKFGGFVTNTSELMLFLTAVLFPGIDFSFRFSGLIIILIARAVIAAINTFFFKENNSKKKKYSAIVISAAASMIFLFTAFIPSFIFTGYNGLPVSGKYNTAMTKAILIDESRNETYENDGSKREVPVYFYYPENAEKNEKFPIIFFSHGAFGYYQSNSSTYMELASNGYIVISMEHPYHSLFTHDSDGKIIIVNNDFMNGISELYSDAKPQRAMEITQEMISLRIADADFAIDSIKDPSSAKWVYTDNNEKIIASVLSMADTDKIGFMGHSLGGATAVSIGKQRYVFSAVFDFDGTMLGEATGMAEGNCSILNSEDYSYPVPILSFNSQLNHDDLTDCREKNIPYVNITVLDNAETGFETYIADTGHMNYTDLPLFSPFIANFLGSMTVSDQTSGTGSVDPEACIKKMNEITLDFFNAYLKGNEEFQIEEGYIL